MASSNRELQSNMKSKEDMGMAPLQSLAFVDPDLVPRAVDRLYPVEFERNRDSEKEGKMVLKYSLDEKTFGQKFLEKEDIDYIYEKGKEQEMYNFDAWYASLFDHSDPAQLELSRRINPSWFVRRMRAIDKSLDMQRKVAKIKLFGIQDKEDVMTTYAISSGRINPQLFEHNFFAPQQPTQAKLMAQYQRGTFAPREYDHFVQPVPQPVGPTMPLSYTGATAHTGLMADLPYMKGVMTGAQQAMPPGDLGMMDSAYSFGLDAKDAAGKRAIFNGMKLVGDGGPDATKPFSGASGFDTFVPGAYNRKYTQQNFKPPPPPQE